MKKKLLQVGNSLAFIIDSKLVKELGLVASKEVLYDYEMDAATGVVRIYFKGNECAEESTGFEIPVFLDTKLTIRVIDFIKKMGPKPLCDFKFLAGFNKLRFEAIKNYYLKTGNLYMEDFRAHWVDDPKDKPRVIYPKYDEKMKAEVQQHNQTELLKVGLVEQNGVLETLEEIIDEEPKKPAGDSNGA